MGIWKLWFVLIENPNLVMEFTWKTVGSRPALDRLNSGQLKMTLVPLGPLKC